MSWTQPSAKVASSTSGLTESLDFQNTPEILKISSPSKHPREDTHAMVVNTELNLSESSGTDSEGLNAGFKIEGLQSPTFTK
jgi:hypothetical protein